MRYIKAIYIGLIGMLLAGCQADQWEGIEGGFQITLSDEATVTTKSTPTELGEPTTDKFKLKIVNEATNNAAYDGAYKSGTIPAAAGTYTITATFGDNPVLALDDPYYKGEKTDVEVKDGETTSVSISCSVANALASVVFPDATEMAKIYQSYWVKVAVESYSTKLEPNSTKSAYFQAGKEVAFYFEGTKLNGQSVSAKLEHDNLPTTFEAADHYKLTLTFNDDLSLDISKVEATTVTINETIPMEWLPKPKVNGFNDDNQTSLTYTETEDALSAQLRFSGSLAIQDVEFSFEFEDPQEKFQALNNKSFVLSELTENDRSLLNAASIILPNLDGTNNGQFDFTAMTRSLQTKGNGEETTNAIKLRVKANNRWSSEEPSVYEIRTVKPEFSISVNEANCWSREFTIEEITVSEGKGNLEKIKENLIYQYYNGNDWVECTTRDNVKGRTQQFKEAAENIPTKEYKVRALYRGAIASSEATATLETPTQLPNSGMEEWYTQELGSWGIFTKTRYYGFYPYSNGNPDPWWTTNNERSQDGIDGGSFSYKGSFSPCVSYTEIIKHGGERSALIYTSGHGGGYASTGQVLYSESAFAGSLFIGQYSWTGKNEDIKTGHNFTVRPTSLKFYYKYIPKNSDEFKVYIELKNDDEIIGYGEFIPETISSETNWIEAKVFLDYIEQLKEATSIYVQFLSTTKTSFSSDDFDKNKSITFPVMGDWNAHIGSMLYIDDISLVYDK